MSNALIEMLKKKRAQMAAGNNDWRPYKPLNGKTIIRILPPWRAEGVEGCDYQFWRDFGQHWIKAGAENKVVAVYACPDRTNSEDCEVCAAIGSAVNYAKQLGDEELEKAVKDANAGQQYLVNVLVMNHADVAMRNVPITMTLGKTALDQILSLAETFMLEAEINLFDLETGVNLVIDRSGSGFDTKYNVMASPKGSSACPKYVGVLPNLDDIVALQLAQNEEAKALNGVAKSIGMQMPSAGSPAERSIPGLAAPSAQTLIEEAAEAEFAELENLEVEEEQVVEEVKVVAKAAPKAAAKVAAKAPAAAVASDADAELDAMLAEFDSEAA